MSALCSYGGGLNNLILDTLGCFDSRSTFEEKLNVLWGPGVWVSRTLLGSLALNIRDVRTIDFFWPFVFLLQCHLMRDPLIICRFVKISFCFIFTDVAKEIYFYILILLYRYSVKDILWKWKIMSLNQPCKKLF